MVVLGYIDYVFLGLIYRDNRFDFRGIHKAVMTVYGCLMVKIQIDRCFDMLSLVTTRLDH